jgi:magnesium and cobalt transporter
MSLKDFIFRKNKQNTPLEHNSPERHSESPLLRNIAQFLYIPIKDIMTPRADIIWVDMDKPFTKTRKELLKYPYSYFPVCRHDLDKILGALHMRDVAASFESKNFIPEKHLKPVLFVAPSLVCSDLLIKMREEKTYIAIVVDEFGGVDGLVTLSDIVEKIIGDMDLEEHKEVEPLIRNADHTAIVDGRMTVSDFEEEFGSVITPREREKDPETVGGWVMTVAGHVPVRGELIKHQSGVIFEVLTCDARRVKRLKIHSLDKIRK